MLVEPQKVLISLSLYPEWEPSSLSSSRPTFSTYIFIMNTHIILNYSPLFPEYHILSNFSKLLPQLIIVSEESE